MTGRQYLINQVVLHILDCKSDDLSDLRIWDCVEGVINDITYKRNHNYVADPKVLRYWDSIADPDGRAANLLVNEIHKEAARRLAIRKEAAEAADREARRLVGSITAWPGQSARRGWRGPQI